MSFYKIPDIESEADDENDSSSFLFDSRFKAKPTHNHSGLSSIEKDVQFEIDQQMDMKRFSPSRRAKQTETSTNHTSNISYNESRPVGVETSAAASFYKHLAGTGSQTSKMVDTILSPRTIEIQTEVRSAVSSHSSDIRTLNLRELDLCTIHPCSVSDEVGYKTVVIGKPGTGKTSIIDAIVQSKRHIIPCAQVYSGTEESNHHYSRSFPESFIFEELEIECVKKFIFRQKLAMKFLPDNPWALLILDDVTDDPGLLRDKVFKGIFKNGRHWKMLFILALQYAIDLIPALRTCVDGTFLLRESLPRNRKILYDNFAGSVIPTFEEFGQIMDLVTPNYTSLFINNRSTNNDLEDCLFWYHIDRDISKLSPENRRFGAPVYWDCHERRYAGVGW